MGPSLQNGESVMATFDWRAQFPSDAREWVVNMIMETLKKQHLPFSGPEGIIEHRKVASRFEDKVFTNAANLTEYLRKISLEMLLMETPSQYADSTTSIPADNLEFSVYAGDLVKNNSWRASSLPYRETAAMDTVDWRTQLAPESRGKVVIKLTKTLKKHHFWAEGINELKGIAARLEENIFNRAVHLRDYIRQVSTKILAVETILQNAAASVTSISAVNTVNIGHFSTDDWRTQQSPDSRQRNVNKLLETLKNHVPYSGEEGINDLTRIAVSFEDLIFNTAINQVDYFRKISLKMQTMEEGD